MTIHDWTRVPAGLFHHLHQAWSVEISNALNRGVLSDGFYALVEQRVDGPEPDVIAVETSEPPRGRSATMTLDPPRTAMTAKSRTDAGRYAQRANRISIRHPLGNVVAVIEIVSPGNKESRHAVRSFVAKAIEFLRAGVHLLIVDLFPPSPRDPHGIHGEIWNEIASEPFELPAGKSLTLAAYDSGEDLTAYIEPLCVGDPMPDMPLFLLPGEHVVVPLATTYDAVWSLMPEPIRKRVLSAEPTA